jgi:HSP20 family molecular chaperone IbpA
MILYHQSPFQFYPHTSLSWTPYIIASSPTTSSQRRCGYKKQKMCDVEKSSENSSKIIYQDRSTRIQHIDENKIEFSLDLPGIKAADTKVEIHNGFLKVEAERKHGSDRSKKVERCFSIKEFDTESEDLHASLQDGVLCIIIPKKVDKDKEEDETSTPIPVGVEYPPETHESDNDTKVRFSVDLPGVSLSNVKLEMKNNTISLQATRKLFEKELTTKRQFTIDTDKADVTSFKGYLVDGVLTIVGSKKVLPGPKQIVVTDVSDGMATMRIENATESKDEEDMVIVETVAEEAKKQ